MAAPTMIVLPVCSPFQSSSNTAQQSIAMNNKMCSTKKKRRRTVIFDDIFVQVQVLDRLTEQECSRIWYNGLECKQFTKDVKKTVKAIKKGRKGGSLCARGLEKYLSQCYHSTKKKREVFHYASILQEQRRQRETRQNNPKLLRMLSTHNSSWARHNAIKLAAHDAEEAQRDNTVEDDSVSCWSDLSEDSDSSISLFHLY
eukprot:CAMPEP_0202458128 /NCGR_PEP_ID=MMETSP1360-20130828/22104_1 /ASSEMBLY_ACC=CAM_ASM_000848 /TAXON_ID=515479 /ORGANISM="Licmophora paradoxa, Strain CCMP2313" /LENGTH=199 /DNA_ID=CAMNT_0049078529 /DNA_START=44 /DNA_END=643 /DNA_ORIENTATION=+